MNSFVPRIGLEPTRLSALAPETSASTISPSGHCDCKGSEKFARFQFRAQIFAHFTLLLLSLYAIQKIDMLCYANLHAR